MKTTAQEEDRAAAQVELKRAYLLVEYGEIDDALKACDAAAQLAASVSTPTVLKGAILTGIGRHKEALALLRQATRRWPDAPLTHLHFAEACYFAGRERQARQALDEAQRADSDGEHATLIDALRTLWDGLAAPTT